MAYNALYPTEASIVRDNRANLSGLGNDVDFAAEIRRSLASGTLNSQDAAVARQTLAEVDGRIKPGMQGTAVPIGQQIDAYFGAATGRAGSASVAGDGSKPPKSWVDNWLPNYAATGDGGITPEQAAVSGGHTGTDAINSPGAAASSVGGWLADKMGDVSVVVLGVVIVGIGLVFAAKSAGVPMPIPKVG